ncbi:hypothetical protein DENSPDRAFT_834426 [Dentipellis sp. KUC8613]|nr:hypothetical protein DENSPDRAFT_834426 [Dentipellis sp. KUC8613]
MDGGGTQRRGRMLPATLVGLQHKEILKNRKRQLAAVLGALSLGDTLALDQALSANYPLLNPATASRASGIKPPMLRRPYRLARRNANLTMTHPGRSENAQGCRFPSSEFTFECRSATSVRLVATREEVAVLHARFEAELARQAAKAAEAAKAAAEAAKNASKGSERAQRKARTSQQAPQAADPLALGQTGGVAKLRGKKKKRSALANASNPHHLRNYVPSRLPNQGQMNSAQANANAQNSLSPFPLQFLSAQIPPRRRKNATVPLVPQLVNPTDEWICPNCEYQLFYGDEQAYRRAVRNRKKILKRRRRARERAAAAASGTNAAAPATNAPEEDVDDSFEGVESKGAGKMGQPKTGREKEGDRGWTEGK